MTPRISERCMKVKKFENIAANLQNTLVMRIECNIHFTQNDYYCVGFLS
jgi:peroxiredoxin